MSSAVDIPLHLALALLLATGRPLPDHIDRRVLAPRPPDVRVVRHPSLGYDEERWLGAVQRHGRAAGLDDLAGRVFRTSSGRVYAPVDADRRSILALLSEPAVVARVASAAAKADSERLARQLGRAPSTISREVRRNTAPWGGYVGYWAQRDARRRQDC